MDEIMIELRVLLGKAQRKLSEYLIGITNNETRSRALDKKENDINQKISGFQDRESKVKRFENVEKVERENDDRKRTLEDGLNQLRVDREKFEKTRTEKEENIRLEFVRIDKEWKKIKGIK